MRSKKMIWIAVAIPVLILGWICLSIDDWGRDWTTNYAESKTQLPGENPLDVATAIKEWAETQSMWQLHTETSDDDEINLHLVRQTQIMRFTDDIHLTIRASDAGSTIEASSRSRIGKGDLGQNPRNLRELESALRGTPKG